MFLSSSLGRGRAKMLDFILSLGVALVIGIPVVMALDNYLERFR